MSPTVKKIIVAIGIAKAVDLINDRRKPKRSAFARFAPAGLLIGLVAAAAYYFANGGRVPWSGESPAEGGSSSYPGSESGPTGRATEAGL